MNSFCLLVDELMGPVLLVSNPIIMITNSLKKHVSPTFAAVLQMLGMIAFGVGFVLLIFKILNQQSRISWFVIVGCLIIGAWAALQTAGDLLSMMKGVGEGAREIIPPDLGSGGGGGTP